MEKIEFSDLRHYNGAHYNVINLKSQFSSKNIGQIEIIIKLNILVKFFSIYGWKMSLCEWIFQLKHEFSIFILFPIVIPIVNNGAGRDWLAKKAQFF